MMKTSGLYLGIDPGTQGCMAVVDEKEGELMDFIRLGGETPLALLEWLEPHIPFVHAALLEKAGAMPKQGVSSTFKYGSAYGFMVGLLTALRISWDTVSPGRWQRAMDCLTKGDKNVTKRRAEMLWPRHHRWTQEEPDGCLIAEYCRRVILGRSVGGGGSI